MLFVDLFGDAVAKAFDVGFVERGTAVELGVVISDFLAREIFRPGGIVEELRDGLRAVSCRASTR